MLVQRISGGSAIHSDRDRARVSWLQRSEYGGVDGEDQSHVGSDHAAGLTETDSALLISRRFAAKLNSGEDVDVQIRAELVEFIVTNFLFGDAAMAPRDEDSLIEGGIIDSTGILELIEFLESHFGIEVSEAETVPENLDGISSLTQFVVSKKAVRETSP